MQILYKFYMHIKAKTLHFFYVKKHKNDQNQEKSTWCILKASLDCLDNVVLPQEDLKHNLVFKSK